MSFDEFSQAFGAKELAFVAHGFGDAIRMKNHNVTGIERDAPFVVAGFFENAEREPREFDLAASAVLIEKRLRLAGIGHAKFMAALLPGGETGGHEAAFDATFQIGRASCREREEMRGGRV